MSRETHNLAAYAKHMIKAAAGGRPREAGATGVAIVLRSVEAVQDVLCHPRVQCDFCGWRGRAFRTFAAGGGIRRGAVCPRCLSLERHRAFLPLFRAVRSRMPGSVRVLDVAPTAAFAEYCRREDGIRYVSVDRASPRAMARMDVQGLGLGSETIDVIVCYHVLDYVTDDLGAMKEFRRVLKAGGLGIFQEGLAEDPVTEEWNGPRADRQLRVRQYGRDFPDRLRAAGFAVTELRRGGRPVFVVARERKVILELQPLPADP